jgi:hypothetical protein
VKQPSERALDACNALLEVIGTAETVRVLERYVNPAVWPGPDPDASLAVRFFDAETALLADNETVTVFLRDLPDIVKRYAIGERYPGLAAYLLGGADAS